MLTVMDFLNNPHKWDYNYNRAVVFASVETIIYVAIGVVIGVVAS